MAKAKVLEKAVDLHVEEGVEVPFEEIIKTIPTFASIAVLMTPSMASSLLTRLGPNRTLNMKRVNELVRAIRQGDWRESNDAIAIDADGFVTNGQHRLHAIAQSGVAVPILIVKDLHASMMDDGRRRTIADVLHMGGHANPLVLAGAAVLVWRYSLGWNVTNYTPRYEEAFRVIAEHPGLEASVVVAKSVKLLPPSVAAFVHYMASRSAPAKANEFFARLADGANLPEKSPILALRNRLTEVASKKTVSIPRVELIKLTIKAWNYFEAGRETKNLKMVKGESFPRFR